jgi:hypothetical protein
VRVYLTDDDYALNEGPPYDPKGNIDPKAWRDLTVLPDSVALMTTDAFTLAIPVLQEIAWAWLEICDAMPADSPMRIQAMAALESFQGATFNAVHGWYRIAGIALRNAVEDILVGLYYQNQATKRSEFDNVTSGKARTPRRGEIDGELLKFASRELVDEVNALYQDELSVYVHRMSDGTLWKSNGPVFAPEQFNVWIGQYDRAFRLLARLIDAVVSGACVEGWQAESSLSVLRTRSSRIFLEGGGDRQAVRGIDRARQRPCPAGKGCAAFAPKLSSGTGAL